MTGRLILRSSQLYSTTFSAAENPLSESGAWVKQGLRDGLDWQNLRATGGIACGSVINAGGADAPSGPYDDSIALLGGFPADHYAEIQLSVAGGYAPGVSHEAEMLVGFNISAHHAEGIEVTCGLTTTLLQVVWWKGAQGDFQVLDEFEVGGFANNDVMRAALKGDNLRCYKNGALVGTTTGITALALPAGNPGAGAWARNGATLTSYGPTRYAAGST